MPKKGTFTLIKILNSGKLFYFEEYEDAKAFKIDLISANAIDISQAF